jgi:Tautomerase enzyme
MPFAKIYFTEDNFDEERQGHLSTAIQGALMNTLGVPPEDFFQALFALPAARFPHSAGFVGCTYSDDLIVLEIVFITGRSKETRLALHRDLNARIVSATGISPDDLLITLFEAPAENLSFGKGLAQRADAAIVP